MQRFENTTGIIQDDAERIAVEFVVDADCGIGPIAANNARISLRNEGHEVTIAAIMWRAGKFPRRDEQGPFWMFHN